MSALETIKKIEISFNKDCNYDKLDYYNSKPLYYIEYIFRLLTLYGDREIDEDFKDIFISIFDKSIEYISTRRDDLKNKLLSVKYIDWLSSRIARYPLIFQFEKRDLDLTKDDNYIPNILVNCILKREGYYHDWYKLEETSRLDCFIDEGVLEGEYNEWYSDGKIKLKCHYNKGVLEGERSEWYPNGQIKSFTTYLNGNIEGIYTSWWSNGNIFLAFTIKDNSFNEDYKKYYRNGVLELSCKYDNGMYIGDYLLFYEDGSLKKKCFYKDGNLEGEYKWLSNDGILLNLSYYINGYLEGESKEWYYDGKLKNIYVYKKGKRKRFQEWDKNGTLIKSKV